jgi:tetratricopeptide (TPR) repeat protein
MINRRNPTVFRWWGFLLSTLCILLSLIGCSSSSFQKHTTSIDSIAYSADVDSLGIEAFTALSAEDKEYRRTQARLWLDRFANEETPEARIRSLCNAVGLAPDNPGTWLQLAHYWRWLGDYLNTMECLDAAATAIRNHDSQEYSWNKKEMQRRTALARAWLHYDRGEWQQGLEWARAARQVAPGEASVRQIYGLLAGHAGFRSTMEETAGDMMRIDADNTDVAWVRAAFWVSKGKHRQAFNLIMDQRPNQTHQAEYWREMGEIAEYLGEYSRAGRWYEESAHVLPFRDRSSVTSFKHSRLDSGANPVSLKVWLAFDRYYVTGSYSAFTSLAYRRFVEAKNPGEKDFWAGQVVNATGTLLRKGVDTPWAYRTRGLVFAYGKKTDRSIRDLRRAADLLGKLDHRDSQVESTLGHLFLMKEDHVNALPHLRNAVELESESALIWRDYGLAQIMSGQNRDGEASLTRALELDPKSTISWYNRGLLYFHQGKFSRAKADLETAARLAPDNLEVINLLQKTNARWQKTQR